MSVSVLGLGAGPLGDEAISDDEAEKLLRGAIALGINVIDTAPSYGRSEVRIGQLVKSLSSSERDDLVIVTKGGYGVPGVRDWSPEVITRGIDQALSKLATDRIDVFVFHSCPRDLLVHGDIIEPLVRARTAGKVRAIGYSGDGDALAWAVHSCDAFDVVECSVNLVDQKALEHTAHIRARNLGVLAKRSLAGAAWSATQGSAAPYVERIKTAYPAPIDPYELTELAIRFAAHAEGISSALMGTRSLDRLRAAAELVNRGPLPSTIRAEIEQRYAVHADRWPGVI